MGAARSPIFIISGLFSGIIGAITLIQYSTLASASQSSSLQVIAVSSIPIIVSMLTMPFITGGALGCAVEQATGGGATWELFISSGKKYYMNLLIAWIMAWLASYLLWLLAAVLVMIGVMSSGGAMAMLLLLILLPISAMIMFVGLMFIEFYDIAIVADGVDFARAFGVSIGFVWKHLMIVVPFAIIITGVKILVWLPLVSALFMKYFLIVASNLSYYENGTVNTTAFNQSLNATAPGGMPVSSFGLPSLAAIMVLQMLIQSVAFAFITAYKAEFYKWRKGIRRITDFDYDFANEGR